MLRSVTRVSVVVATALVVIGLATSQPASAKDVTWLGVYTQKLTPELRDGMKYKGSGVLVTRVVDDSPADKAGLQRGDIIERAGSLTIDTHEQLADLVSKSPTGRKLDLQVVRTGRRVALSATLATRAESDDDDGDDDLRSFQWDDNNNEPDIRAFEFDVPEPPMPPSPPSSRRHVYRVGPDDQVVRLPEVFGRGRLGVRVESLSPDLASYFGSKDTRGALVIEVIDDTPAERAGLHAGDVVTKIGTKDITDADDLIEAVRSSEGTVAIALVRHGQKQTVNATLDPMPRTMSYRRGPSTWRYDRDRGYSWRQPGDRIYIQRGGDRDDLRRTVDELRLEIDKLERQMDDDHEDSEDND